MQMCGPEYSPPQFFVFSFHPAWSVAVVHLLSCVWLFVTPWTAARHTSMSFTISRSLLKLMSIKSMMPSNHLILCHPLLLLPSIFPSIWVFSSEPAFLIRWPKYWSFSFSICPSNEYSGLILLGLTSLLVWCPCGSRDSQESSPAPVWKHQFFSAQPSLWPNSHLYMTPGKTIALTRLTFVSKVMSLLFNILSSLVTAFLPRSKHLLISWLQSPSAVILEPPKIKSVTVSIISPSICHEVMGLGAMILVFPMLSFKTSVLITQEFIRF